MTTEKVLYAGNVNLLPTVQTIFEEVVETTIHYTPSIKIFAFPLRLDPDSVIL